MSALSQIAASQIDNTQIQTQFVNFQTVSQTETQQYLSLQNDQSNSVAALAGSMANAALQGLQQM